MGQRGIPRVDDERHLKCDVVFARIAKNTPESVYIHCICGKGLRVVHANEHAKSDVHCSDSPRQNVEFTYVAGLLWFGIL